MPTLYVQCQMNGQPALYAFDGIDQLTATTQLMAIGATEISFITADQYKAARFKSALPSRS